MGRDPITVLLAGHDADGCTDLRALLAASTRPRAAVIDTPTLEAACERLRAGGVDLVVIDARPGAAAADIVERLRRAEPTVPTLVLVDGSEAGARALREGAHEIVEGAHLDQQLLAYAVRGARERARADEAVRRLGREQAARARAEDAAARSQYLFRITDVLGASLDYKETLPAVAALLVPVLADRCEIEVVDENGERRRVDERPPTAVGTHRQPAEGTVLETPLVARGQEFGTLRLLRDSNSDLYAPEDVAFANECARKIALAIDIARLYRAREDVLGIVSHDLRNPLNVINLVASTLERGPGGPDATVKQAWKIRRAVERMNRLIEDLLDITRLDGGNLPMEPRRIEVPALVGDACDLLRAIADEKGVTLRREVGSDLPAVHADRDRLLQVLSNILGNAIKFTPAPGLVTVSAALDGADLRMSVSDTGPGIPPGDLPKVFNRFWQGERSTRQGAGLGLAIAKRIVQAHGGRIGVDSVVGAGSTFYFTVPASPGSADECAA
jgi:signal transduction histidine kinase